MIEMKPYEVYIKIDDNGCIIAVNSSEFLTDTSDWIKIDEGYGDKYHHAQGNYFPDGLYEFDHVIPLYKYVDGTAVRRSDAEIQADIDALPAPEPTAEERIAQLEEALALLLSGVTE